MTILNIMDYMDCMDFWIIRIFGINAVVLLFDLKEMFSFRLYF